MNRIINADAIEGLWRLPDKIADMCVTSPPYYGLRNYGVSGQIGLELTPHEYIQKLVKVFREVRRVLRDDGTLWVNIGDSYAGNTKPGMGDPTINKRNLGDSEYRKKIVPSGLKPKDIIGIPWMLAFALRDDGWYLRQDIIWSKPNPMPESVRDRCTKAHEYIFLLSKSRQYYYDQETIAEPATKSTVERLKQDIEGQLGSDRIPGKTNGNMKAVAGRYGGNKYTKNPEEFSRTKSGSIYEFRPKRNKRSVWTIATKGYKEAHFATFPPELVRPCILAGSRKGGIILDPFFGSGTVGEVAVEEEREYIGIEINSDYIKLAERRIAGANRQMKFEFKTQSQ